MISEDRVFRRRVLVLLGGILLWTGVIIYRLVDLQIIRSEELKQQTAGLHYAVEPIPARRGEVHDANGKILAISRTEPHITADPAQIENPKETAAVLAKILNKDRAWQKKKEQQLSNKKRRYCHIERRVPEPVCEAIKDLKIKGLHFQPELWRLYPNGWIGSHILGFVSGNGKVKEGIEFYYDKEMSGKAGKREVLRDGRRKRNSINNRILREPLMGSNVQLTIDANIQLFAEDALRRGMERTRARNITAIVMEVETGAIRAMANMPDFNPNRFSKYNSFTRKNRAVVDVYEPASAFKIVTVASALDAGTIAPDDIFYCEMGGIQVFDRYIRDNKKFDNLSISEILWYSSNVGAIKVAHSMPPETFYRYIENFGFGTKTGVGLPAESKGILRPRSEWSKVSSSFLSMGHEISSTPLQMLVAASVIANDGLRVKPYIVESIIRPDGQVESRRPTDPLVRVVKSRTARIMRRMLRGVVDEGTAEEAAIPGVSVFGKTGTAQRLAGGSYSRKKFNASFVGFFPAERPRYGIIVVVHDPKGRKVHGGQVAAPIFSEIGKQLYLYDQAKKPENRLVVSERTPNWPSRPLVSSDNESTMPDLTGLGLRNLLYQSHQLGIKLEIDGHGRVVRQSPEPGSPIPEDRVCNVFLKEG